jgi:hypothetical protein
MGRNEWLADEAVAKAKLLENIKTHLDPYLERHDALSNQFNIEDTSSLADLPLERLEQIAAWVEDTYSSELELVETDTLL